MEFQALVSIAPWTFIAQICNLLIQAALFKRFLFEPVRKVVAKRQAEVNDAYALAAEAERAAQEKAETYDNMMLSARSQANEIIYTATTAAKRQSAEILQKTKEDVARMKEKAQREIAREKTKALNEVKDTISDVAMEIASRVLEKEIDATSHQALVNEFVEKIGEKES